LESVENADVVIHLAAQVAVTTSVQCPRDDFETNAIGTLNLLESVRKSKTRPILLYSSTNKVYGDMHGAGVEERAGRYAFARLPYGIPETYPLSLYSPYGCSKGAADQYVLDYARTFGLKTIVFRQSCIYGPHQHGMEDQGWIAWFAKRALERLPITIFGDGKQTRDVLFVDDLIAAYDAAIAQIDKTTGQAYNIGGGPANVLSLSDVLALLEQCIGGRIQYRKEAWRPGDQRVFVSDTRKAMRDFAWRPTIAPNVGVLRLLDWLQSEDCPAGCVQNEAPGGAASRRGAVSNVTRSSPTSGGA
jgi:CDP-paratose 2-epimerase